MADTTTIAPNGPAGVRFTVASRPQRRFSANQTANIASGPTSLQPIQLPATGFVRKISLYFNVTFAAASAGAVVAGDGPFNLVNAVTLTDATGQPIYQPVSGYNLYLLNKYLPSGVENVPEVFRSYQNPVQGPEYAYSTTSTAGSAVFRLDLDLEQDPNTGYGCIPNLDSNASLQLKIDLAAITNAFSGTGISAGSVQVIVSQWYWAPVSATTANVPNATTPAGFGDFVETRYETQTVTAQAENTVTATNRGGLIKGIIAVSRAAGARVAFPTTSNVGLVFDNNPIDEGIRVAEQQDYLRRTYGYIGSDAGTSYAPLSGGASGLDNGVLVWNFASFAGGRDSWLSTRVGTLLQLKLTPGASATQLELVTQLAQVRDAAAFYNTQSV